MGRKNERVGMGIKIKKYDDIFDVPEGDAKNVDSVENGAVFVNPSVLRDFNGHPFKVVGKGIDELMDSIREQGVLSPIIVRPVKGLHDEYEIISGHRRKYCALQLGISQVPVVVRDIGDDEAVLAMVDSNIQREDILPSEKAFAYKMKLEAIKRQGERTDLDEADKLTSGQVVRKLESADVVGEKNNESGRQIRRHIRLTELPKPLLDAVDSKKMSFNAGVELSYLRDNEKAAVAMATIELKRFPTLTQAKKIRELSLGAGEVNADNIAEILVDSGKSVDDDEVNFERADIRQFFPRQFTARQIEEAVVEILKEWKAGN